MKSKMIEIIRRIKNRIRFLKCKYTGHSINPYWSARIIDYEYMKGFGDIVNWEKEIQMCKNCNCYLVRTNLYCGGTYCAFFEYTRFNLRKVVL